jgi:hypothetical protein
MLVLQHSFQTCIPNLKADRSIHVPSEENVAFLALFEMLYCGDEIST